MCWRMVARPTGPTARLAKLGGTTPSTCMITGIKKAASCSLLTPNRTPSVLLNSVHCETDAAWGVHTVCTVSMIHSIEARTHTCGIYLEGPTPLGNVAGASPVCSTLPWQSSTWRAAPQVIDPPRCAVGPTPGRKSQHAHVTSVCAASPLIPSPGLRATHRFTRRTLAHS